MDKQVNGYTHSLCLQIISGIINSTESGISHFHTESECIQHIYNQCLTAALYIFKRFWHFAPKILDASWNKAYCQKSLFQIKLSLQHVLYSILKIGSTQSFLQVQGLPPVECNPAWNAHQNPVLGSRSSLGYWESGEMAKSCSAGRSPCTQGINSLGI